MVIALAILGGILILVGLWLFMRVFFLSLKIIWIMLFATEKSIDRMLKRPIESTKEYKKFEKELEELLKH